MKKIMGFTFLLFSITSWSQDELKQDTTSRPAITEIGKPIGNKMSREVGKEGESLMSPDGVVELIIPPGALTKKTNISIQTMTNTLPNGNGQAYRLEPSGIHFAQPVKIIFHYDPEESADSTQWLLAIAMQDDTGLWYGLQESVIDTVAKTVSGLIDHFSVWASFDHLKLRPVFGHYRLKVKQVEGIGIWGVDMSPTQQTIASHERVRPLRSWRPPQSVAWFVNLVKGGNAEYGTLEMADMDESDRRFNRYTAPDKVPGWNPVFIMAKLMGASFTFNGRTCRNPILALSLLIYDEAYEVSIYHSTDGGAGSVLGNVAFLDTGRFVISVNGDQSRILERTNKNTVSDLTYAGCKPKIKKTGWGTIHILEGETITITPATFFSPAKVEIQFIPAKIQLPLLEFTCPPIGKGKPYVLTNQLAKDFSEYSNTLPQNIRFDAIPGLHTLPGTIDRPGLYYKVTVRQLTDDE
ncbi:MAG TPA: hypothetical protein VLJ68_02100 [Chitinophagaceae bacterium]|nr:hypothetical protein [Chitinophagaceae bacterium]